MAVLIWDASGQKSYESGLDRGVIYPMVSGAYPAGHAWNGLIGVTESPEGAEPTDLWANNNKYGTLRSPETHGFSIEAYTYPDAFAECDGSASIGTGVTVGQQTRKPFGFSYRTKIGNDSDADAGYKIHLVYGCTASPSERAYSTINDSPDAMTLSWDVETVPVSVTGKKPTSHLIIDTTTIVAAKLTAIEDLIYGTAANPASLPLPDAIIAILTAA